MPKLQTVLCAKCGLYIYLLCMDFVCMYICSDTGNIQLPYNSPGGYLVHGIFSQCVYFLINGPGRPSGKLRYSSELTFSAETVAFVKITRQALWSYAVALLFSKDTKFDFPLWLFRTKQKTFFSFLVFLFTVKNWNYCGASIKGRGRNVKRIILRLGLTKWQQDTKERVIKWSWAQMNWF